VKLFLFAPAVPQDRSTRLARPPAPASRVRDRRKTPPRAAEVAELCSNSGADEGDRRPRGFPSVTSGTRPGSSHVVLLCCVDSNTGGTSPSRNRCQQETARHASDRGTRRPLRGRSGGGRSTVRPRVITIVMWTVCTVQIEGGLAAVPR